MRVSQDLLRSLKRRTDFTGRTEKISMMRSSEKNTIIWRQR